MGVAPKLARTGEGEGWGGAGMGNDMRGGIGMAGRGRGEQQQQGGRGGGWNAAGNSGPMARFYKPTFAKDPWVPLVQQQQQQGKLLQGCTVHQESEQGESQF